MKHSTIYQRTVISVSLAAGLILPAVSDAQLAPKYISSAIPRMTTPRSAIPVYLIAFIAFALIAAVALRSSHRGTRRGGRD